ncbi:MAG: AAA family ATPase [Lachnospiraceae bacterium]|jgi:predicted ATPase|nr:AAA family ATPase [Lachnospiraceae bacterium]
MRDSLFVNGLTIDWDKVDSDSYLHEIAALREIDSIRFEKPVTFFVGENGTGKSTLLEAIAASYGINPEGGSKNFRFSTRDTHSSLYKGMTLRKGYRRPRDNFFLRAESFYNVATQVEEYRDGDRPEIYYRRYGGRSLHEQSHGESFLALMQNRFQDQGFYLLDEPEAALSPQRQLTLLICIHRLAQAGSQFLIASHSPILLGLPDITILSFDDGEIRPIEYTETESYQVTEMFLNHREYLLERLLGEEKQV